MESFIKATYPHLRFSYSAFGTAFQLFKKVVRFSLFLNHTAMIFACEACVYLLLNSYYAALDAVSTAFFKIIRQF
ncbi:Hypothetical protein ACI5QM_02765 [Bacillus subtilis]